MLLSLLWTLALALIGTVLVLMLGLALGRVLSGLAEQRHLARRELVMAQVLAHLDQAETSRRTAPAPGMLAEFASVLPELSGIVRGSSRQRLIVLAQHLGLVDHLLQRLDHWRFGARVAAARDLHLFEEPRVLGALRARLADHSYEVRLAAARSLVKMAAVEDVGALIPHLADSDGRAPPRRLGQLFQDLAATHGAQLVDLVRGDLPVAIRELALEALGGVPDLGPIVAIRAIGRDPSPVVRAAGLRALARLGHPAARHAIERGLGDPEAAVREEAARCAARLGLEAVVPGLRKLLNDEIWRVRRSAVAALASLGAAGRAALQDACREGTRAADLAALAV